MCILYTYANISNYKVRKEHAKECELDQILSQHHATVNTILKMAASNSVDKLCEKYGEMEQRNLALFKFLTDLNHEVDTCTMPSTYLNT